MTTIFEKITTAIERFKKTADRMGHIDLADALNDLIFVVERQDARIRALEKELGITPVSVVTAKAGTDSGN